MAAKKLSREKTTPSGKQSKKQQGMRVAFIGTGYVGLVSGTCFAEIGHTVICVDNNEKKIRDLQRGNIPIYEPGLEELVAKNVRAGRLHFTTDLKAAVRASDIIFIAVNTPPRPDGRADLSFVAGAARDIAEAADGYKVIVDKSTVPVKTGEKVQEMLKMNNPHGVDFDVVSNPEFLREGSTIEDFLAPDRIVVGVQNTRAEKIMRELYKPIHAPFIVTDINSAELIKHASNSFLATKISFANALAAICELANADVELVTYGMGLDKRIGQSFLRAGIGYGGSCFPKDISAFIKIAEELTYDFHILKDVERINMESRKRFIKKIHQALWVVKGKRIAVWGLAFKPNTDDMRSAPAVDIIRHLVEEGAHVVAYDPEATEKAKGVLGTKNITYVSSPYDAVKKADALVIVTEWKEFAEANLQKVHTLLRQPLILDGRNIFDAKEMEKYGFLYHSIGRGKQNGTTHVH